MTAEPPQSDAVVGPDAGAAGAPAGSGRRVAAYLIDGVIGLVVMGAVAGIVFGVSSATGGRLTAMFVLGGAYAAGFAWFLVYTALQGRGGSIGMRLLRLRLRRHADGTALGFWRALVRNAVWAVGGAVVVGYFSPLFDRSPWHRGWHDLAAGAVMTDAVEPEPDPQPADEPEEAVPAPVEPSFVPAGPFLPVAETVPPWADDAPATDAASSRPDPGDDPVISVVPGITRAERPAPDAATPLVERVVPVERAAPVTRAVSAERVVPVERAAPTGPGAPGTPAVPGDRVVPVDPAAPGAPGERVVPASPVHPAAAGAPGAPVVPAAPVERGLPGLPGTPVPPGASVVRDVPVAPSGDGSAADDDAVEDTRITTGDRAFAVLVWDDGIRQAVYRRTLFGRNPAAEDGALTAPIRDETLSLSKTHFELGVDDDRTVWIVDRHSTNGVVVRRGVQHVAATPGERVTLHGGDVLEFGDRHVRIEVPR